MMANIWHEIVELAGDIAGEVAIALLPMAVAFIVFQIALLRLPIRELLRILSGFAYAFIGLLFFLVGVNLGFAPAGDHLGRALGARPDNWILIPIGVVIGLVVVLAEPAVRVLVKQVQTITGGAIRGTIVYAGLAIGVGIAVGLDMLRNIFEIPLLYFLVPGYILAIGLTKFSPPIFTSMAFDSGGAASGPMAATFILPMSIGVTAAISGLNPSLADTFGVVSLIAMMPLIVLQIVGVIYNRKLKKAHAPLALPPHEE